MLNIESIAIIGSIDLLQPVQSAEALAPRANAEPSPQPRPSIVWRSQARPLPRGPRVSAGLYLVTPASEHRAHERRRQRAMRTILRTHFVESAYLAATLGTALVIWWSVR